MVAVVFSLQRPRSCELGQYPQYSLFGMWKTYPHTPQVIYVDTASGSKELVEPLRKLGLPVEPESLKYGRGLEGGPDVLFEGLGANGVSVSVVIEFKKVGELIQSLRSQRLQGHQLIGLQGFDYRWLLVEGQWRHDDRGQLTSYQGRERGWTVLHGKMSAMELEKQLLTLEMLGGLHVRFTNTRRDSLRTIASLYRWWTDTALDRHSSHIAIYEPQTILPMTQFRRTTKTLPGLGIKATLAAQHHFKSIRRAVTASAKEWAEVETKDDHGRTRRLGVKCAAQIVAAVTKEES